MQLLLISLFAIFLIFLPSFGSATKETKLKAIKEFPKNFRCGSLLSPPPISPPPSSPSSSSSTPNSDRSDDDDDNADDDAGGDGGGNADDDTHDDTGGDDNAGVSCMLLYQPGWENFPFEMDTFIEFEGHLIIPPRMKIISNYNIHIAASTITFLTPFTEKVPSAIYESGDTSELTVIVGKQISLKAENVQIPHGVVIDASAVITTYDTDFKQEPESPTCSDTWTVPSFTVDTRFTPKWDLYSETTEFPKSHHLPPPSRDAECKEKACPAGGNIGAGGIGTIQNDECPSFYEFATKPIEVPSFGKASQRFICSVDHLRLGSNGYIFPWKDVNRLGCGGGIISIISNSVILSGALLTMGGMGGVGVDGTDLVYSGGGGGSIIINAPKFEVSSTSGTPNTLVAATGGHCEGCPGGGGGKIVIIKSIGPVSPDVFHVSGGLSTDCVGPACKCLHGGSGVLFYIGEEVSPAVVYKMDSFPFVQKPPKPPSDPPSPKDDIPTEEVDTRRRLTESDKKTRRPSTIDFLYSTVNNNSNNPNPNGGGPNSLPLRFKVSLSSDSSLLMVTKPNLLVEKLIVKNSTLQGPSTFTLVSVNNASISDSRIGAKCALKVVGGSLHTHTS